MKRAERGRVRGPLGRLRRRAAAGPPGRLQAEAAATVIVTASSLVIDFPFFNINDS